LPIGQPAAQYYGGARHGQNLYSSSIVALDGATGKVRWYFQLTHHDVWDYDAEAAPSLMEVVHDGKKIPVVVLTSKTGLVFILDRNTGKSIYGVEERPVPQSDVPGEQGWPTEPFPLKPPPLTRMTFKPEEVAKITPEHQKFCESLMTADGGTHNDGPFTRYGTKMSIVFPGTLGAVNWHGGSYDPNLGYVFYNIIDLGGIGKVAPTPKGSSMPYERTSSSGRTHAWFWNEDNYWPCQEPPWGRWWR